MEHFIYAIGDRGEVKYVLSFLPHTSVFGRGLFGAAIVGYIDDPRSPLTNNNVHINPAFVRLFHKVVKEVTLEDQGFRKVAFEQCDGFVYIIDLRDRHYPNTRPYDIIGSFPVRNREIESEGYQANENYLLVSQDGLFRLPRQYNEALIKALEQA